MRLRPLLPYFVPFLLAACVSLPIGHQSEPAGGGGSILLDLDEVRSYFAGQETIDGDILVNHRLPRTLLALLTGGTLACVGAVFQILFRNPLATPYTLGATGGAGLGAFLVLALGLEWSWGAVGSMQLGALVGGGGVLFLIYRLARRPEGVQGHVLLLAGVTVGILCAGIIMLITYFADPYTLASFHRWTLGGLDIVGLRRLGPLFPILLPSLGLLLFHAHDLNHLALGEEMALGHGVEVERVQRTLFLAGGAATAAVVSLAGPIAFLGLIVPHAVRRLSGPDQRTVLPASFLLGGAALALCDTAGRLVLTSGELPVGIVTAVVGGPLFIRLLIRGMK